MDGKRATLACDVRRLPHGVFVQVLPVSWTNAPGFRVLAPDEVAARHVLADCCANGAAPFERGELARQWRGRSIYEGCSQEVPIFRPFRGLSVRDGLVFALDWTGIPRPAVAPTNAVPGRIYWEGLE